jgi:tripartite-type tricarboxylate transporter receptor subunit TctC
MPDSGVEAGFLVRRRQTSECRGCAISAVEARTRHVEPVSSRTVALALMLVVAATFDAAAQAPYPNRPIRLILPYPPGAGTDFTARTVGEQFSKPLGQPVVVDNRPGAAATLGHSLVAKAAPDGYTLLLATTGGMVSGPALCKRCLTIAPDA